VVETWRQISWRKTSLNPMPWYQLLYASKLHSRFKIDMSEFT